MKISGKVILFISGLMIITGLMLYCLYSLNIWRGVFWEDISQHNELHFWKQVGQFIILAGILIYSNAAIVWLLSKLGLQLRRSLNKYFVKKFLNKYHKQHKTLTIDNPDERLSYDLHLLTQNGLRLAHDLIFNLIKFIIFLSVLSGLSLLIFKNIWIFPTGTVIFTVIFSILLLFLGKKLVRLNYINKQTEASYRYGLSIARMNLHSDLKNSLRFKDVLLNNSKLFGFTKIVNICIGTVNQSAVIIPILFLVPLYFTLNYSFGLLMQSINAVSEAYDSLSFIINNFTAVSELIASYKRVYELYEVIE